MFITLMAIKPTYIVLDDIIYYYQKLMLGMDIFLMTTET